MAHRSRVLKRQPRSTAIALSPCWSIKDGKIEAFKPKRKENKRLGVTTLPNGKLIVKVSDLN